ncbi:MAG: DUF5658 family protein [Candidatus Bathyarchaeota archaeon]|nr:DUF5658 family protein [Candidatus Bathyarchaeota archaeon]
MTRRGKYTKKKEGDRMERQKLLFLLLALNIVDLVTTVYGFSLGASEFNPLFPGDSFATKKSLLIKTYLPLIYSLLFMAAHKLSTKAKLSKGLWFLKIKLMVLVGFYIVVVSNNLLGIVAIQGKQILALVVGELSVL